MQNLVNIPPARLHMYADEVLQGYGWYTFPCVLCINFTCHFVLYLLVCVGGGGRRCCFSLSLFLNRKGAIEIIIILLLLLSLLLISCILPGAWSASMNDHIKSLVFLANKHGWMCIHTCSLSCTQSKLQNRPNLPDLSADKLYTALCHAFIQTGDKRTIWENLLRLFKMRTLHICTHTCFLIRCVEGGGSSQTKILYINVK